MAQFSDPGRQDYIRTAVYILIYLIVISGGAFLLLPERWYVWTALVVAGLVFLVSWHKGETIYQCPNCDHLYEISFLTGLTAPHGVNRDGAWLVLLCPNCTQRHKTRVLKKEKKAPPPRR